MSIFNVTDVRGCNYTMEVLSGYFNTEVRWVHTSDSQNDEYCKYDMDWTATTTDGIEHQYIVENKDRRLNYKTKMPQFYNDYPTVMFNIDKYVEMMKISRTTGKIPLYTADYADGVAVFDLRTFPEDCIEQWKESRNIGRNSVLNGEVIRQERMMIPKSYGKFYPKQ